MLLELLFLNEKQLIGLPQQLATMFARKRILARCKRCGIQFFVDSPTHTTCPNCGGELEFIEVDVPEEYA